MSGRTDALIPIEVRILAAAIGDAATRPEGIHGFGLATLITGDPRRLIGHGTLYRALARLEHRGFLESHWEDYRIAEAEHRPRRRLYRVTPAGHAVHESSTSRSPATA